jgi:hypothetical protein
MNKPVSIALLVVGVALLAYGLQASHSFSNEVSRTFTGSPTDKTMWFLIGGAVAALVGFAGLFRGSKSS